MKIQIRVIFLFIICAVLLLEPLGRSSSAWADGEKNVLLKTYLGAAPDETYAQKGFRGILTRVKNPGAFNAIRVYAHFERSSSNVSMGTLHVGIMSGDSAMQGKLNAKDLPYYATGKANLPETGRLVSVDISLDSEVNVSDECLYVAIWNTSGSGCWLMTGIDENVVIETDELFNCFFQQYSPESDECYVDAQAYENNAMGGCAAFDLLTEHEPQPKAEPKENLTELFQNDNPLAVLHWDGGFCGIFQRMTCIGDSLTAGTQEYFQDGKKGYFSVREYSYPAFMARTLGIPVDNLGYGGYTAIRWYERAKEKDYFKAYAESDAYIIALGTNDIAARDDGMITGDISDINLEDYKKTNATTDVGAYGAIIQNIYAQNPKAKIFCVTVPYTRNYAKYNDYANEKYRQLAEVLNCYVIDLAKYGVQTEDKAAWKAVYYSGGHLNTLGYKLLSVWYMSYIDWIIQNNPQDFAETAYTHQPYSFYNAK